MPVEPPPTPWTLPDAAQPAAVGELVGIGADLEPGTLLAAYRAGLFPMPLPAELRVQSPAQGTARAQEADYQPVGWWSPDPRGILPLENLRISRSLRRSLRHFEIRVDTAFDEVIHACADPSRPYGWIDDEIIAAYRRLHAFGWAHSVEAWSIDDGVLAGGLYGVSIGGFFAGESMFHSRNDASKVALAGLVSLMRERKHTLLDIQWNTHHLSSLGATVIPRDEYLRWLGAAIDLDVEPLGPLDEPRRL